jgi:uncharacterized protein YdhG (YjbR/CyaY superfamily)
LKFRLRAEPDVCLRAAGELNSDAMATTDFKSVDEYIASQPEAARVVLERVRGAIREAMPQAEEAISYQIPTFKLRGRAVLHFAGWKKHYSLYPAADIVMALKDELEPYEVSKGTIRFPLSEPVPVELIGRIAKLRAEKATERERGESLARKAR